MNCKQCKKDLSKVRKSQLIKSPINDTNRFCSSECFMSYEDSRVDSNFKLYDSKEEKVALDKYLNSRGFF